MDNVSAMAGRQLGRLAAKAMEAARPSVIRRRAAEFAQVLKEQYEAGKHNDPTPADDETAVQEVADAMRGVDWAKVKAATAAKTAEATHSVKAMAQQVDWGKVQPVAAQVSSALIAAVASGQIPLGGPLGGRVVRTIMNDHDLAGRVAQAVGGTPAAPPDFRPLVQGAIETTAREV
jgi:hypothetical protein